MEAGESFENAAGRELIEETGIRGENPAELIRLIGPSPSGFNRPNLEAGLFRLTLGSRPAVTLTPGKHSEYRWVAPEDLKKLKMMDINRSRAVIACASLRSKSRE